MCSSIQFSSISSCSGENPTAPSTPKPPALETATTTSRQWVKAKIGNSMPSSSQMGVRMVGGSSSLVLVLGGRSGSCVLVRIARYQATGIRLMPLTKSLRSRSGGAVRWMPGSRSTIWRMVALISARARLAPRQ